MDRLTTRVGVVAIALLSILTASIAAVVAIDSGGGPAQAAATSDEHTISVSGQGTVQGVPDTLVANLSVHSHESSVQEALDQANSDMNKVKSILIGKGVSRGDLQTTDLELNPSYDNHGNVNGYDASESLSVRIHPLSHVGEILSAAATAAGNSVDINGLSFDIANDSDLVDQARKAAFEQAKAAAEQDAELAGKHLGDVVSVKESTEMTSPPQPYYEDSFASAAKAADVPISAGKQPVSVTLDIVWSID